MYRTTKGQLITIWVFGIFGWIVLLEEGYSGFSKFLMVFIPFALVFYTIGWRKKRKEIKG